MSSLRIGIHVLPPSGDATAAPIYGRAVAIADTVRALCCHAAAHELVLLQGTGGESPAWPAELRPLAGNAHLSLLPLSSLKQPSGLDRLDAFHDPDRAFDEALALRARYAARWVPITATLHVASYAQSFSQVLLPALLQEAGPCDALVCTSRALRRAVEELLAAAAERLARRLAAPAPQARFQLPVIPFGVDTERFRPRDRSQARRALGWREQGRVLLWLGRISVRDKADLALLIRCLARLRQHSECQDVRLVLAGWGAAPDLERLRALAAVYGVAEAVLQVPAPLEQRHLLYSAADLFVSPVDSAQETFGLAPLEALASGLPQVVSDWNGYRDTVQHGETGWRVPTTLVPLAGLVEDASDSLSEEAWLDHLYWGQSVAVDEEAWLDATRQLLTQPALHARFSEASRARALSIYAWPKIAAEYFRLWAALAEIAREQPGRPTPDQDLTRPLTTRAFSHYASSCLAADAELGLGTDLDACSLQRRLTAALPGPGFLAPELLAALCDALLELRGATTMSSLARRLARACGVDPRRALQAAAFALKQGCLRRL
jgi:glycosyltransferase involved in cell wall biosynthesis